MLKLRYITVVGRKSSVRRILPLNENLRKKKSYNKKKVKVLRSHPVSNFLPHCNIEIFSTFPNMAENGTVLPTFIHICIMYKYIYISYIAIMCRCTSWVGIKQGIHLNCITRRPDVRLHVGEGESTPSGASPLPLLTILHYSIPVFTFHSCTMRPPVAALRPLGTFSKTSYDFEQGPNHKWEKYKQKMLGKI